MTRSTAVRLYLTSFFNWISTDNFRDSPHVHTRNIKERTIGNVSAKKTQLVVEWKIAV